MLPHSPFLNPPSSFLIPHSFLTLYALQRIAIPVPDRATNGGPPEPTADGSGMPTELWEELRSTLFGRTGAIGGVLPPAIFLLIRPLLGIPGAAISSLVVAALIITIRAVRGATIRFAVSGAVGALIAAAFALRQDSTEAYFLPGIISGAATTAALLTSIIVRRPLVALTSWVTRGWPLGWYLHPSIRPAYTLTTWLWVAFFGLRTTWQWSLYSSGHGGGLLLLRVLGGWPATVLLLVVTYVLGRWRLGSLDGPSVEEFTTGSPPPWVGQERGF